MSEKLAINGGKKAVVTTPEDLFIWPMITKEIEEAVLNILRAGNI